MAMSRRKIVSGPAIVTFRDATFYTNGGIVLNPGITTEQITTDQHGPIDEILADIATTITFTPAGQWIQSHLNVLYPYATPQIGSSILGATEDDDVVIQSLAGEKITIKNGGITQMPDLILSAIRPAFGQCTITCFGADNTEWTDTAKRAVIEAQAFADTSFDSSQIKMAAYYAALSGMDAENGWSEFSTMDGWTISSEIQTFGISTDAEGTIDMRLQNVKITASCVPIGVKPEEMTDLLPWQGEGVRRGMRLSQRGKTLTIAGKEVGDPRIVINRAVLTNAPLNFDAQNPRNGEAAFSAFASYTEGVMQPLFTLGTVPAP